MGVAHNSHNWKTSGLHINIYRIKEDELLKIQDMETDSQIRQYYLKKQTEKKEEKTEIWDTLKYVKSKALDQV